MAKISVSIDDALAEAVRHEAKGNVSRFVSDAVRDAVSRAQMLRGLAELDEELGPVDADVRAQVGSLFDAVEVANARAVEVTRRVGAPARWTGSKETSTKEKASVSKVSSKRGSAASRGGKTSKVTRAAASVRVVRED